MSSNKDEKMFQSEEDKNLGERTKMLQLAEEMTRNASVFMEEKNFGKAVGCFNDALKIRISLYGIHGSECSSTYYQYGIALLQHVQSMNDIEFARQKREADERIPRGEQPAGPSIVLDDDEVYNASLEKAFEVLNIANQINTKERVLIQCGLAKFSALDGSFDSAISAFKEALSDLEKVAESDHQLQAEIILDICNCFAEQGRFFEALPYCESAMAICKEHEISPHIEAEVKEIEQQAWQLREDLAKI